MYTVLKSTVDLVDMAATRGNRKKPMRCFEKKKKPSLSVFLKKKTFLSKMSDVRIYDRDFQLKKIANLGHSDGRGRYRVHVAVSCRDARTTGALLIIGARAVCVSRTPVYARIMATSMKVSTKPVKSGLKLGKVKSSFHAINLNREKLPY